MFNRTLIIVASAIVFFACNNKQQSEKIDLRTAPWENILKEAEGSSVNFVMWQGSSIQNDYINNFVVPKVKEYYNIDLKISGGQGPEIVQLIMGEKQAGTTKGQSDMVWINGETFFQLNQIDGLWGPFVDQLPNTKYIDFSDTFISTDFQQPINGMECPWAITQFAFGYDTAKVKNPPKNLMELEVYLIANPGTFTISNDFTGMSLLKTFLAEISGSSTGLDGKYEEGKYQTLSDSLWNWINRNKKYFWKEGSTFPKEHSKMDQLYASGELNITYGFNEGGVETKTLQGLFPKTSRVYPWDNGTVKNANYLGISYNAANKAGAMTVINFLVSPEAQLKRMNTEKISGNTVLSMEKLSGEWKSKFKAVPKRIYGANLEELENHAIREPSPKYMLKLYEEFRTQVIEK